MTVEKVESCSNYTFAVRCALDEAPWSSWSQENTVLTKLNSKNTVKTVHASASQPITAGYARIMFHLLYITVEFWNVICNNYTVLQMTQECALAPIITQIIIWHHCGPADVHVQKCILVCFQWDIRCFIFKLLVADCTNTAVLDPNQTACICVP